MSAPLVGPLRSCHAKVDRASEHLATLKRECAASVNDTPPYAPSAGQIDAETGWCDISLGPREIQERLRLSAIAGDVHHNLRSALDYIIAALVTASGAALTKQQFPLFEDRAKYREKVADGDRPIKGGNLGNVKYGLAIIESVQPYHTKPDPVADPLAHLNRFSNSDKHRQIATYAAVPSDIQLGVEHDGVVIDARDPPGGAEWEADKDLLLRQLRFARPYPSYMRVDAQLAVHLAFTVPPRAQETDGIAHDVSFMEGIRDRVHLIVQRFEALR